jgi:hypothetical protein
LWDLAVAPRDFVVAQFLTLVLHLILEVLFPFLTLRGRTQGAGAPVNSDVAEVTFEIYVGALAIPALDRSLEFFTVVALCALLSAHVSDMLAEEAVVGCAVAAIVRGPLLVVAFTVLILGSEIPLALSDVKTAKVEVGQNRFVTRDGPLLLLVVFCWGCDTVQKELLRDTVWLNNDVFHEYWESRDLKGAPRETLIPSKLNLSGGNVLFCDHN